MLELDMTQRRKLSASAHHLNPTVTIGKDGLTENVIGELDRNLLKHELIKVKVLDGDRDQRTSLLKQICLALSAAPVDHIGRILIIYRINPDKKTTKTIASDTLKPNPQRKMKLRSVQSTKKTKAQKSQQKV